MNKEKFFSVFIFILASCNSGFETQPDMIEKGDVAVSLDGKLPEPPNEKGHFPFSTIDDEIFDAKWGSYSLKIYYPLPTLDGVLEGPFPSVVFAHGFCANGNFYKWIAEHLANHGYIVCLFTSPQPCLGDVEQYIQGIDLTIKYLALKAKDHSSVLFGLVEFDPTCIPLPCVNVGVVGHSMGSEAALIFASHKTLVKTIILLAPCADAEELAAAPMVTMPVQIQSAELDGICSPTQGASIYQEITSSPRQLLQIAGGNHVQFLDYEIAEISGQFDNTAQITVDEQHRVSSKYFTAWLNFELKHLSEYSVYLFGEFVQDDFENGTLSDLRTKL